MDALHDPCMHTCHTCMQMKQDGMLHASNPANEVFILPCRETLQGQRKVQYHFWQGHAESLFGLMIQFAPRRIWSCMNILGIFFLELELSMGLTAGIVTTCMQERFPISCCMCSLGLVLKSFQLCACV